MWFCFCWWESVRCFCSEDLQRFRHSANTCVRREHCSARFRCCLKRDAAQSGRRAVFLETGNFAIDYHFICKSLSAVLPVFMSAGRNLWMVQPFQPCADSLGIGEVCVLYGLRESLPGFALCAGNIPFSGMYSMWKMCGGLSE